MVSAHPDGARTCLAIQALRIYYARSRLMAWNCAVVEFVYARWYMGRSFCAWARRAMEEKALYLDMPALVDSSDDDEGDDDSVSDSDDDEGDDAVPLG